MSEREYVSSEKLVEHIVEGLLETKGVDIVHLDLRGVENSMADFFVIASATSDTHLSSLAGSVEKHVKINAKERPAHLEGQDAKEWVLLDYVNVVVHLFLPTVRDYYALERLWGDAKTVSIEESFDTTVN